MATHEPHFEGTRDPRVAPAQPGGLLDLLSVAAVVLDSREHIVFWSPEAEEIFGYADSEVLGQSAAMLVREEHRGLANRLFVEVLGAGAKWAGSFPVRHKDGSTRLVEFRNSRLVDNLGGTYVLGIVADETMLQRVETDLAFSQQLVAQTPIGIALLDTNLRYLTVNSALARINGISVADHIGKYPRDILAFDTEPLETDLRQVLRTGKPLIDQCNIGRTLADPNHDHAWSVSYFRIESADGRIIGVANSVIDVSERVRADFEKDRARRRLSLIAEASARIGTSLEVDRTAKELVEVAVPELADIAVVDVIDDLLALRPTIPSRESDAKALQTLAAAGTTHGCSDALAVGDLAACRADQLITQCIQTGQPVVIQDTNSDEFRRIARSAEDANTFAHAGVHSYLAVPLIARHEVLGAFELLRTSSPLPFDQDDILLAGELASRAGTAIDNARWHQNVRNTAETLQRSLLPGRPPPLNGLEVASLYQPARATQEVGGDWYDVIPVAYGKTVLVVGDVMGNGIDAAATMGRLRTATGAFADLDLSPDRVLQHLDKITQGLENYIATCLYAVFDPRDQRCVIANAGHLPPVLDVANHPAHLVDLPTGAPLGVGGVSFHTTTFDLKPGDRLVLYTDGLVETRHHSIDDRLKLLLDTINGGPRRPLDDTCPWLLHTLRQAEDHDDVAVLIAESHRLEGAA